MLEGLFDSTRERGRIRTWIDTHIMDTFQMVWMIRSLGKSIYFGLAFSIIMVGASTIFARSTSEIDIIDSSVRIQLLISFVFDNITTYVISCVGFSLGLLVNTWDATLLPIRKNFKQFVNRAGISIFFALFSVFVILQIGGLFGDGAAKNAHLSMSWVNMIIAVMFGFSQTWRSFYIYAVLDKKQRREFLNKRKDDKPIKSVFRFFIPFVDKTQLVGSLLWSIIIVATTISVSSSGAHLLSSEKDVASATVVAIIFTVTLSFLSALLGVIIRLWNSIKPFGTKDTLYPHWERKQGFVKINPDFDDK